MSKLFFVGEGIIKHNGKNIVEYDYQYNEELILEFIPFINTQSNTIPYAITLTIEEGEIIIQSKLIKVIKWRDDFEITFYPQIIESYTPPVALAQKTIYIDNYDITATVYKDNKTRIIIEAPEIFYIHTPRWDFNNPTIRMNQSKNSAVIAINGVAGDKEYLNIFLVTKSCQSIWEDVADKIEFNKNNITYTKNLSDMKGRVVTYTSSYNGKKYQEISKKIKYTYEHKYRQELLPYLLVEALKAYDIDDVKKILDSSLDATAIQEFFGEIEDISQPKYCNYCQDSVLAIIVKEGNNLVAKLYEFEINEEKITNIIELD